MRMLILVSLVLILASSITHAQVPNVEYSVTVSDGAGGTQELKFGLDPAATDTIDTPLGEAELPPPPPIGVFDARFIGSDIAIDNLGAISPKFVFKIGLSAVQDLIGIANRTLTFLAPIQKFLCGWIVESYINIGQSKESW